VSELIRAGFFVTVQLGTPSFVVATVVGLLLGVLAALNQNGPLDYVGVFFATVGASLPDHHLRHQLGLVPGLRDALDPRSR
jgi:ABC-type dipeptide/oligopeptide/nickel transport system permease component